jgi:beta-phosphoglucomutase-like phosphatase (HAD superfamily)
VFRAYGFPGFGPKVNSGQFPRTGRAADHLRAGFACLIFRKIRGTFMRTFDAAIFDLDGTLIDSLGVWEQVDRDFLARRGIALTPDYTAKVSAMCFSEAAEYTIHRFGFRDTPEELIREWNGMVAFEYANNIGLKPLAGEYLSHLLESGVTLGVATALPEELYTPVLRRNGVYDRFSAFASVGEVSRGKGFPDVYLLAAERLGVPPERCVVFEDVVNGIRGVKAAGMKAVGVYDERSAADGAEIARLADRYIRGFSEMME